MTTGQQAAVDPADRQQRLADRVGRLVGRGSAGPGPGGFDRWLLLAGGVLLPLGFLFVGLGWVGASRTPLLFEQIPYLISGGLLGLALVFAGGFVYFAYWQTLLVRESRTARADLQASLARLEALLAGGGLAGGGLAGGGLAGGGLAGGGLASGSLAGGANGHQRFVATATGTMIHRPDCSAVAGRPNLRTVSADAAGLTACGLCTPLATPP